MNSETKHWLNVAFLGSTLQVLIDIRRFLQSADIVQDLLRQLSSGKQNRTPSSFC